MGFDSVKWMAKTGSGVDTPPNTMKAVCVVCLALAPPTAFSNSVDATRGFVKRMGTGITQFRDKSAGKIAEGKFKISDIFFQINFT